MAQFNVDSEAVHSASIRVRGSVDKMRQEINSMQAHLQDLQNSWTGQASTSFQTVIADWRATQARVEESLETINQALSAAAQQYAQAEENTVRMFTS